MTDLHDFKIGDHFVIKGDPARTIHTVTDVTIGYVIFAGEEFPDEHQRHYTEIDRLCPNSPSA